MVGGLVKAFSLGQAKVIRCDTCFLSRNFRGYVDLMAIGEGFHDLFEMKGTVGHSNRRSL